MAHDGYKVRIYDDIIWVYEYQPDGLTASGNKRFINRPQGHGLWLREKADFLNYSPKKKAMMWYTYYCDHAHHLSIGQIAEYIGAPKLAICLAMVLHRAIKLVKGRKQA